MNKTADPSEVRTKPNGAHGGALSAIRSLLSVMELQELREAGEAHLSQPAMRALWDDAKAQAKAILAREPAPAHAAGEAPPVMHERDAPEFWKSQSLGYAAGFNACRKAMLAAAPPPPAGDEEAEVDRAMDRAIALNKGSPKEDRVAAMRRHVTPKSRSDENTATSCADAGVEVWRSMETAPRDGTQVRLLVNFTEHDTVQSGEASPTIGSNSFDNTGEDQWDFAGWSWEQDCYTAGEGTPVGWLPMLTTPQPPALLREATPSEGERTLGARVEVKLSAAERQAIVGLQSNVEYDAGDVHDEAPRINNDEDAYWAYHTYWAVTKMLAALAPQADQGDK